MMDPGAWEQANSLYLSAALKWLRACLLERFNSATRDAEAVLTNEAPPIDGRARASVPHSSERLAGARREMEEAECNADPAPALVLLGRRFGLSEFEQNLLLLCVAAEFDDSFSPLFARCQSDPGRVYPTFALALSIFEHSGWDALSPE